MSSCSTLLEWGASKLHHHTSARQARDCMSAVDVCGEGGRRKKGIERVKLGLFRRHRRLLGVKWNSELHLDPSLHPLISYIPRPLDLASSFHSISSSSLILSQTLNGGEPMTILACSSPLRQQSPPAQCPMFCCQQHQRHSSQYAATPASNIFCFALLLQMLRRRPLSAASEPARMSRCLEAATPSRSQHNEFSLIGKFRM
jgi:hypothetical protein